MAITHSVKFTASAKEAAAEILKYEDQIVSTAQTVDRYAASLSGEQMFKTSHNWVAAVEQIGGVTKLTADEKERLHRRLEEVVEKYEALGHTAPTQLREVYEATKPAGEATDSWAASVTKSAAGYVAGMATWETAKQVIRGVTEFVWESVQAYAEEEARVKQLTVALQAQGTASPQTVQAYRDLASGLQAVSIYGDEALLSAQGLLVQIGNVAPGEMQRALTATMDLAAGLEIDLQTAAKAVAKASAGQTTALREYGIVVDQNTLQTEGFSGVLDLLQQKLGGQAQAQVDTLNGRLSLAANLWEDLREQIGGAVATSGVATATMLQLGDALKRINDLSSDTGPNLASLAHQLGLLDTGQTAVLGLLDSMFALDAEAGRMRAQWKSMPSPWKSVKEGFPDANAALEHHLENMAKAQKIQKAAAEAAAEAAKRQDALFGRDVIARAKQYATDLGGVEHITRLTTAKKQDLSDAVGKALDAYRALGKQAPEELHRIWIAATEVSDPALTRGLPEGLLRHVRNIKDEAYWVGQATVDNFERGMTYGDPGFFMDWMLNTPGSGMLQYDPRTEMPSFGRRIGGAIGDGMIEVAGQLPETFAAAFTGGGGAAGAFKAIGLQIGGEIGQAIGAEIGQDLGKSLKGSLGEKLGGALGGALGSAVGFAIQGVVALIGQIGPKSADEQILGRVGARYGAAITQGLAQEIEANAKSLFRGDWLAAEVFDLSKIIDAAGGVTTASFAKWVQATRDIFVMAETGKFTTEQAGSALDQTFAKLAGHLREAGSLASAEFLELIALQERFSIESGAVESYVASQAESAIGHLSRVVEGSAIQSQAAATAMADTGARALQALLERGVPLGEALQQYDAYTASLTKRLAEAGFHGTEAFARIQAQSALAKDAVAGPLITAIVETGLAIRDLHNGNLLTQESFAGLVSQVSGLTMRWGEQGRATQDLFPFIGNQLQTIWELQQEFGYSVDETTQNLLDQAEAAGVVGEEHRSTEDRMIEGIGRMADATERLVDLFGKAWPDAMARGTDAIVKDVKRIKTAVDDAFQTPPRWDSAPPGMLPGISDARAASGMVSVRAGGVLEALTGAATAWRGPIGPTAPQRSGAVLVAPAEAVHVHQTITLDGRVLAKSVIEHTPSVASWLGGRG